LYRIGGVLLDLTVLMGSTHPALNQGLDVGALRGDEFVGQLSRRVQQIGVADKIGYTQFGETRLSRTEYFTRPALRQIRLGQTKTVLGFAHQAQPRTRFVRKRLIEQQDAVRIRSTSPDAAAQLMQLRQAHAVGIFDDHQGGIGHIHPDLNDFPRVFIVTIQIVLFNFNSLNHNAFIDNYQLLDDFQSLRFRIESVSTIRYQSSF
jgi:hypothetical protein